MAVVNVAALLAGTLWICAKAKESLTDGIPVAVGILTFLLYGLAFVRRLSWIDGFSTALLAVTLLWFLRRSGEEKKKILRWLKETLVTPGAVVSLAAIVLVSISVSQKTVAWWDDYNFWATDVKSLFYLDGFAGKYANVAPEFGDYPPGTQLLKWWFAHLSGGEFREGLMFAGYYVLLLSFLCPLLRFLRGWNPLVLLGCLLGLWFFPSVAEVFYLEGMCADLVMALAYGAFLAAAFDRDGHSRLFYTVRMALYLMMMGWAKNTGLLWMVFALLFLLLLYGLERKKTERRERRLRLRELTAAFAFGFCCYGSWMLFCLGMRRVAKLTGTALRMAAGGTLVLPDYASQLVKAFAEAFFTSPLHRSEGLLLDATPFLLWVLLSAAPWALWRLEKKYRCFLSVFLAVSGVLFYAINLLCHLTIFAQETQYLEAFGMVSSMERYGAPFTVGGLYLIGFLLLKGDYFAGRGPGWVQKYGAYLTCLAFIALFSQQKAALQGLFGYREKAAEELEGRAEMVASAETFLAAISEIPLENGGARVLYLRDAAINQWVKNTYVGYEASPVSVMFGGFDAERMQTEEIIEAVENAHTAYLYVDRTPGDPAAIFAPLLEPGGSFAYETVYRVVREGERLRLDPLAG